MATVEQDTVVTVHYTGTFLDTGQVFDTSEGGEPSVSYTHLTLPTKA